MITLLGYQECKTGEALLPNFVNTTSRSKNWGIGLSPFFLGPVELYDGSFARIMENCWQFSKIFRHHIDENDKLTTEFFRWRRAGFNQKTAERYPMGKGVLPVCSFWNDKRISYIEARKQIYIPMYKQAVEKTEAFQRLKEEHSKYKNIFLWDFDSYDHRKYNMSYDDVINCEDKKMGHAFVLAMMLEGYDFSK